MLSEDEKEAIEQFKGWREYIIKHRKETNQANDLEFYIRTILNLITKLQKENEEKDKIIKLFEHECIKFKAFCRRLRKYGHDVDLFNQGQEYKCNQFLNLINGESYWDFAGKYFDETNEEIQKFIKEKYMENNINKNYSDVVERLEKLIELRKDKTNNTIKYDNCIISTTLLETTVVLLKTVVAGNRFLRNFIFWSEGKYIEDISATGYVAIRREGYIDGRQDERKLRKDEAFKFQKRLKIQDIAIHNMAVEIIRLDKEKSKFEYDKARMWETERGVIKYFIEKASLENG